MVTSIHSIPFDFLINCVETHPWRVGIFVPFYWICASLKDGVQPSRNWTLAQDVKGPDISIDCLILEPSDSVMKSYRPSYIESSHEDFQRWDVGTCMTFSVIAVCISKRGFRCSQYRVMNAEYNPSEAPDIRKGQCPQF